MLFPMLLLMVDTTVPHTFAATTNFEIFSSGMTNRTTACCHRSQGLFQTQYGDDVDDELICSF
jgi:hypothetical protein